MAQVTKDTLDDPLSIRGWIALLILAIAIVYLIPHLTSKRINLTVDKPTVELNLHSSPVFAEAIGVEEPKQEDSVREIANCPNGDSIPIDDPKCNLEPVKPVEPAPAPKPVEVAPAPKPLPKTQPSGSCEAEIAKYDWNQNTALAVARAESGLRPHAVNNNPRTKDYSVGCFQVNIYGSNAKSRPSEAQLKNPAVNVQFAHKIYKSNGSSFIGQWGVCRNKVKCY